MLNFQVFGESGTPIIIVHGLFGSIANWRGVARELAKEHKVYIVDQRNHGDSEHLDTMSYFDMAADLDEFIASQQLTDYVLCGHSMGGKACMTFALADYSSNQKMRALIVLDIAPVAYTHSHAPYLDALSAIDLSTVSSRAEVEKMLQSEITEPDTRLFLMQSLERKENLFRWKINIPVLQKYMTDITGFPMVELSEKSSDIPALFLYGKQSDYVKDDMHANIQRFFPNTTFDAIDAGHWLHIEQRQAMLDSISLFLA